MTTLDYADSRTLWQTILAETAQAAQSEPMLASFLHQTVLRHSSIDRVLAFHLSITGLASLLERWKASTRSMLL